MTIRYLGSKARIADAIVSILGDPATGSTLVDAFAGTGSISSAASDRGWPIHINDTLASATALSRARLLSFKDVPFSALNGYDQAIATLNNIPGVRGFVTRAYSPMSKETGPTERRYFSIENAMRLDAWRTRISEWVFDKVVSEPERDLLVADLLLATNSVANTAGTYGSYLKDWSASALRPVSLTARALRTTPVKHQSTVGRAEDIVMGAADVAYLDPPYTKRQYAAYYHVLETVALGDEPELTGSTGLRPWKHLASDFSYQSKALDSIVALMAMYPASRLLLSYSNQGHADLRELTDRLSALGEVTTHPLGSHGRYTPNPVAVSNGMSVQEYVFELVKVPELAAQTATVKS